MKKLLNWWRSGRQSSAAPAPTIIRITEAEAGLPGLRGYAICTAPRTGSELLCHLLEQTGVLGHPREYFNLSLPVPSHPQEPLAQARLVRTVGTTANGVYGVKIFAHQHDRIATHLAWTRVLPNLRFVFLTRADVLAQAISWTRAAQTGQYYAGTPAKGTAHYDGPLIAKHLRACVIERGRWEAFFARTGIEPVRIVYEDFCLAPQQSIDRIAALMEISGPVPVDVRRIGTPIQRDALSAEWTKRFRADFGDRDHLEKL